jgi:L-alanine-DL-glutamate epimerase-like enolase superfamily enzyme
VGAIDFNEELSLLKAIRNEFGPQTLEIKLDANGAFAKTDALEKLRFLSKHHIHSIEQPIKQGQFEAMRNLCHLTPIPIALDEGLIGIEHYRLKVEMVEYIRPQYIILKPSLIGGLHQTKIWSQIADERKIGWWVTSALEGNIGLNAIAQWTFLNGSNMPQGLGTGQVFSNNLPSSLEIRGEELWYSANRI